MLTCCINSQVNFAKLYKDIKLLVVNSSVLWRVLYDNSQHWPANRLFAGKESRKGKRKENWPELHPPRNTTDAIQCNLSKSINQSRVN